MNKKEILKTWLEVKVKFDALKKQEAELNKALKEAYKDGAYEADGMTAVLSTTTKTSVDADVMIACLKKAHPKSYAKYTKQVPDENKIVAAIELGELTTEQVKSAYIEKHERRLAIKKEKK
jgi:hypothetical protein